VTTDFLAFCRMHGIQVSALPPLGVWRRFKTDDKPLHRNGAVKWMGDHGFIQNHATMTEVAVWRAQNDGQPYVQSAADKARVDAARAAERQRRIDGMKGARALWARSNRLLGGHPYLTRKGLSMLGCNGLRVTHDGRLLIPMLQGEVLLSVQSIDNDGAKLFFPGAPTKGAYHAIVRQRAAVTAFCEGFATGAAIFQSVEQANVVVCFNASNMIEVAKVLKPTGSVVWCADNDHGTQAKRGFNPGVEAARNAAELAGGGVAYPEDVFGSLTDWADVLKERGVHGKKYLSREILKHAQFVA